MVTSQAAEQMTKGPTRFEFVTDGPLVGLQRALAAAEGQDVCIMGGPTLARHFLGAGPGRRVADPPGARDSWGGTAASDEDILLIA